MSSWYYLMAQLPALPADSSSALPVTEEYFLELCGRFLDKKTVGMLKKLSLEPPKKLEKTGYAVLDAWYDWERKLRLVLAQIRARKLKKDIPAESESDFPIEIVQTARTACGFTSPLEAELYLNKARFDVLNQLMPADAFSTDAVIAYAIRLKLADRIRLFDEEKGKASYKKIYEKILANGETK